MSKPWIIAAIVVAAVWSCANVGSSDAAHVSSDSAEAGAAVEPDTTTGFTMYEPTEMALLMRGLFDSLEVYKQALEAGHNPEANFMQVLENIHGAELTDPSIRGPELTGFTNYFLEQARALAAADSGHVTHYSNMINACIDCHRPFCPGPIVRIKKLHIADE